jgi:hypothetical protein
MKDNTGANQRTDRNRLQLVLAILALSAVVTGDRVFAQNESARTLTERSAIVVRGKVLKTNASNEPLVAASSRTAVILVQQMYAGSEIAGDQTGRKVTVILSRPQRLKVGEEALFFGRREVQPPDQLEADGGSRVCPQGRARLRKEAEGHLQASVLYEDGRSRGSDQVKI